MNIVSIIDTLKAIWFDKKHRIIFWNDSEKEFEEIFPSLSIDGVSMIRLDQVSTLDLKIKLEMDDKNGKYLLYSPTLEPPPEVDWLYDIRLYSYTFHADKASIILKELNLNNQSMRPYIAARHAFFRSQDRLKRLMRWAGPDDSEEILDLKMLTVITQADQPDLFTILMKLFESSCKNGLYIDFEPSKLWADLEKLELHSSFWKFTNETFGYEQKDHATLNDLLIRIFVTDFSNHFKDELPSALSHFVLKDSVNVMNCSVFLNQWRCHLGHFRQFNITSSYVSEKLNISGLIASCDIENLIDNFTFEDVERRIISRLRDSLVLNDDSGLKEISNELGQTIKKRLDGYWAMTNPNQESLESLYRTVYRALEMTMQLFYLRKQYDAGFSYPSGGDMFDAYTRELYLFDQYYRLFHELADIVEAGGWDVLKPLRESVENCYSGWFMERLALAWGEFIEEKGLMETWTIPGTGNQYDFYRDKIKQVLSGSARNRVFVIVSDGLRYEAAEELTRLINGKYRLSATLEPMLGVLPSYTGLGMAALLPHNILEFKGNSVDVLADSRPTASFDDRSEILKNHQGIAVKADDLTAMTKEIGRDFIRPHRLVYVYHDQIDSTGDKAATEGKTFDAVRRTVKELLSLVGYIINTINGTRILITADHGFIYQEKKPDKLDKNSLDIQPGGAAKSHKRFFIGKHLGKTDKAYTGSTRITANTDTDMEFWLAKGTNRFHFVGGARYFHGGAMLQEITIPVVSVVEMKGRHLEKSEIKQVGVSILNAPKKIVTNIPRFDFIQTEETSERVKPRTLKISLRDGHELISNEETLTFDSSSSSMDDRKKTVRLPLKSSTFDNKKEFFLVIRNAHDDTEYDRIPVIIDIAFANDF